MLHFATSMIRGPVVVRGIGDIGSAVAHRLFREGYAVVLHDVPMPTTTRRGMAFTDAVFGGHAALDGVHAVRAHDLARVRESLDSRNAIPVYVRDFGELLADVRPSILVDARMRKHDAPEIQRGLAALTIGLGPDLVAGRHADVVVESARPRALPSRTPDDQSCFSGRAPKIALPTRTWVAPNCTAIS